MTESKKSRILEKIAKCLRLSKSSEPHEAAAAMRQAQKLMQQHGIDETELNTIGYISQTVAMPVQVNKTLPLHVVALVNLVTDAFGVYVLIGNEVRISDRSYTAIYYGPSHRVQVAAYSHTVIWRAMNGAYTKWAAEHPYMRGVKGARTGFYLGWLHSVKSKVEAIGFTADEKDATMALVKRENPVIKQSELNKIKVNYHATNAGKEAGEEFSIHRPMAAERSKIAYSR